MENGVATKSDIVSDEVKKKLTADSSAVAVGQKGGFRETARVDMGSNHTGVNNIIQFDIVNSQAGAIAETVRIGSLLGLPDAYKKNNTTASGVDSVNGISDNFGINLLQCQGFSDMTVSTPMFIKTIKVISSSVTQLNKQFSHKTLLPDFTIFTLTQNIAFTREKSDQAADLLVARGSWLVSSRNFLEFQSVAGQDVSLIMELASINDVQQFVSF